MNLVIDRGNTQVKYGIFDQCQLIHSDYSDFLDKQLIKQLAKNYQIKHIIVSTVVSDRHEELISNLSITNCPIVELNTNTPLPFQWHYKSKATIGKDRLAAVAGAISLYANTNMLVIDAGTAITYEVVNNNNEFLGGNISPGMAMRFKALNKFTSRLPLLEKNPDQQLIGNSTTGAIQAGLRYCLSPGKT